MIDNTYTIVTKSGFQLWQIHAMIYMYKSHSYILWIMTKRRCCSRVLKSYLCSKNCTAPCVPLQYFGSRQMF